MDMFGGFSAKKLKPQLKMASSRLQIAANKKAALSKQQMRDVAVLLAEEPPKEELAKIRAEALIREDNAIEAYEILQLECELLSERIKLLQSMRECPPDLKSCVCTLIWASERVDISELPLIRKQFKWKYGKEFEQAALNNVGGVLNERVVSKLSVQPPAGALVQTYLERICEQFEVDWKPMVKENLGEAMPTAAPVGYSVQVAGGTGLGPAVMVGQQDVDAEIHYQPPPKGDIPMAPSAEVFVPQSNNNNNDDDFGDVDIFVPTIPTAPPGGRDDGDSKNDGGGDASTGGGSGVTSSYADLAARFDQLNKSQK